MAVSAPPIVLFTYPESVVGRRMEWYLTLRSIPYSKCIVDTKMPRPVLARLGIHYRRIPILAAGRDIYCDSRCIIDHLERLYTERPKLGSGQPYQRGIERILESWVLDGPPFMKTAAMIPPDASLAQHQAWLDDRAELTGRQFSEEGLKAGLKDALSHARLHLQIVEEDLLGDDRQWLSGGHYPGLADIHVLWVFDWMTRSREQMGMMHAYPWLLNEQNYPRTFEWIARMEETSKAALNMNSPKLVTDDEAVQLIESAAYFEPEDLTVDDNDPTGLAKGDETDLIALDSAPATGMRRRDVGKLEGLTITMATIGVTTKNHIPVRIHYQRANVRVAKASGEPRLAANEIP